MWSVAVCTLRLDSRMFGCLMEILQVGVPKGGIQGDSKGLGQETTRGLSTEQGTESQELQEETRLAESCVSNFSIRAGHSTRYWTMFQLSLVDPSSFKYSGFSSAHWRQLWSICSVTQELQEVLVVEKFRIPISRSSHPVKVFKSKIKFFINVFQVPFQCI